MKLTFLGAAHEVTGSCTLLEACGKKILVDCGMEQGPDIYENSEIPVTPAAIDFVFLTHAHIDHSGKLPLLIKNGFCGNVYATTATRDLCAIMLADAAHIQETEAVWKNRRALRSGEGGYTPMYTLDDVKKLMPHFRVTDYKGAVNPCDGIFAVFYDAGHLLGSSSIKISVTENGETHHVVFSGDVGTPSRPLLCPPNVPDEADILVIESTYGDSLRPPQPKDLEQRLAEIINRTITGGGNVVIPSFAIGRTQELLYMLRRIKEQQLALTDFPVYLDSPLAIEATDIYKETLRSYFDEETNELLDRGINPVGFDSLHLTVTSDDSKMINADPTPKVIISSSGMCEAGRIRHHLKHNLWRSDSTVLFVGYQVPGTLGYALLNGAKKVKLFGEEIEVRASIVNLPGISGHADKNQLTEWLGAIKNKPEHVFIVHGEESTAESFANHVHETFGYDAVAPYSGDAYDLITNQKVADGSRKLVEKKAAYGMASREKTIFDRLVAAGQRLVSVIQKCQGMANKDLSKFADQINALCDKWDR